MLLLKNSDCVHVLYLEHCTNDDVKQPSTIISSTVFIKIRYLYILNLECRKELEQLGIKLIQIAEVRICNSYVTQTNCVLDAYLMFLTEELAVGFLCWHFCPYICSSYAQRQCYFYLPVITLLSFIRANNSKYEHLGFSFFILKHSSF